jgi:hypothetical protein
VPDLQEGKEMKKIKNALRVWIAGASVAGFIFGWATFAHSNKPVALAFLQSQSTTNSTAASITQTGIQTFQAVQQPQFSTSPRLRTGGS